MKAGQANEIQADQRINNVLGVLKSHVRERSCLLKTLARLEHYVVTKTKTIFALIILHQMDDSLPLHACRQTLVHRIVWAVCVSRDNREI